MTLSRQDLELVVFEGKAVWFQWTFNRKVSTPEEIEWVKQAVREVAWANEQLLLLH